MKGIENKRRALLEVYPYANTRKWRYKVLHMPPDQVLAVYAAFDAQGKIPDVYQKQKKVA